MKMTFEIEIEFDYNELKSRFISYHYNFKNFDDAFSSAKLSPEHLIRLLDNYNCLYSVFTSTVKKMEDK